MAEIVIMPKLGFDMAEGTLVRWVLQEGEEARKGSVLAEIETDKATVEVESNFEGIVARHLAAQGDVVPVNHPIAVISAPGEKVDYAALLGEEAAASPVSQKTSDAQQAATSAAALAVETVPLSPGEHLPDGVRASPLARRVAAENKLDLTKLRGTGPLGRITRKDVEAFLQTARAASAAPAQKPAEAVVAMPAWGAAPPADESITINKLRAAIGRRMTEAKQQVPHFYVTHEYDMAPLLALRKQTNTLLPDEEKLSVNDFIIKATALALRQYPNLNASIKGNQVLRHGEVNIGVAVAVEGGLLTVVCRNADFKPLRQIASDVRSMIGRARDGKVRPDDIEGSTFSISNLGMYDVESFIAIINPPEAAILAVGSARETPVVIDGEVRPGIRMKATVSVDHRLSDGAEAAQFMQALAQYLEQPLKLLLA